MDSVWLASSIKRNLETIGWDKNIKVSVKHNKNNIIVHTNRKDKNVLNLFTLAGFLDLKVHMN